METETIPTSPANADPFAPRVPSFVSHTYSVEETAQVLGVSVVTVYRLIARRLLRPLPHMRHKRIPRRQVHAFIDGVEVNEPSHTGRLPRHASIVH